MAKLKQDPDRFITARGGVYQYRRKVPAAVALHDSRAPKIRISLKTDDISLARIKRDALERADDELWASRLLDDRSASPLLRHQAAVRRAEAMGFTYKSAAAMVAQGVDIGDILDRVAAIGRAPAGGACLCGSAWAG